MSEHQFNRQNVFNRVVTHLRAQGKRSLADHKRPSGHTACRYRNRDGLKCAIGGLFPDELYKREMDVKPEYLDKEYGCSVDQLLDRFPEVAPHITGDAAVKLTSDEVGYLGDLQGMHDNAHDVDAGGSWEPHFERFAKNHRLTLTAVL